MQKIKTFDTGLVNVIIETPRGAQNKYSYDPELQMFKLKKTLPMGSVFPFDFGFIPGTMGEDGDPLDILVIMDQPVFPGCLVTCRLVAVLKATQQEKRKKAIRNDRLVAIAETAQLYKSVTKLNQLSTELRQEIADFFVNYNEQEERIFTPLGWAGRKEAMSIINAGKR